MLLDRLVLFTLCSVLLFNTPGIDSKQVIKPRTLSSTRLRNTAQSVDYAVFNKLLTPVLRSRVPGSNGHHMVKKFISGFMADLGWDVKFDTFDQDTIIGRKRFTNIVATANPKAKKYLVLTAHYDSKILPNEGGKEFFAATDSAVPVAMMMYIASQLDIKALKKNNDYTLQFAFFDGEEAFKQWTETDSIYGSRHLAEIWSKEDENNNIHLSSIETLILLDLIGEKNPRFFSFFRETHDRYYTHLLKIQSRLWQQNQISSQYFAEDLYEGAGIQDDHLPFLGRGVPILHVIPYPFPKCWHKICDDGENIDQQTIEDLLRIFLVFFKENMKA